MEYKRSGRSGILFLRISLGLWQNFRLEKSLEEQEAILFKVFGMGITYFDLASSYGFPTAGRAEENFGSVPRSGLGRYRDKLFISIKAGLDFWPGPYGNWGSREYLVASLDSSSRCTGLECVDVFYHHHLNPEAPLKGTTGALLDIVRQGKALYVGISSYQAEGAEAATHILGKNKTPCFLHQSRYNMFEHWTKDGLLELLDREDVGCICYNPLAQGAPVGRHLSGIPKDSRASEKGFMIGGRYLTEDRLVKIRALDRVAGEHGQSLTQMILAWVPRRKGITSILIGASSTAQLEDNVEALDNLAFSRGELAEVEDMLRR